MIRGGTLLFRFFFPSGAFRFLHGRNVVFSDIIIAQSGDHFNDFESRILDTRELFDYENIAQEKTAYHQNFMRNWLRESALPYSFEELWQIREECILKLSEGG